MSSWDELKERGSAHYKTGTVELIDLYRAATPHPSYNAFDIKALTDIMKYAFRILTTGYNGSDVYKIQHYLDLLKADKGELDE